MPAIRGLTIAVGDWYARTLEICLPRNMRHLAECVVVSSPGDAEVHRVARSVPDVRLVITDAFTRHGAMFNKGLAMEEGLTALGRSGWILIHDADILLPELLPLDRLRLDAIHGAKRRILDDVGQWSPDLNWRACPARHDGGPIGYFQLFHAQASSLAGKDPWYDVSFAHAGGGDAYFLSLWHARYRSMLPIEVLHLGPVDRHWFGTSPGAVDHMARFVIENGWSKAIGKHDRSALDRVAEVPHRVEVPGYPASSYELPFVRRSRAKA